MKDHKILLVDDDVDFVQAIQTTLEGAGFEVMTANDGEAGLSMARKSDPSLIILDVMMPKQEGFSVCHTLKNEDATSHIPIIIMTSLGQKKEGKVGAETLAKGHRADAYMEKPVEPKLLIGKVNELIKKSGQPEEKKVKILLVDDDPDFVAAVKLTLEENHYEVIIAYTGEDGLEKALVHDPDLVLLDVMLPGKDGFAVCKELKEDKRTKRLPVVILTSVEQKLKESDYATR